MPPPRTRRLRHTFLALVLLGLGLWLAGNSLWQLGHTAAYVHEAVVVTGTVTDMRRKPFESWRDSLGKGHWATPGDVSYQPTVRFTLPGGIDAIRSDMDIDTVDYQTGETVSIISPPGQPGKAHINRWKFLWAVPCLHLGAGALLTLIGYAILRRRADAPTATTVRGEATPQRNRKGRKAAAKTATPATASPKPRRSRKKKSVASST